MSGVLRLLRAQRTGVLCGVAAALLLGLGSLIMDAAPGHYRGLHGDDLRFFLEPRAVHAWMYALAAALALWGVSAAVCTWDALVARWRRRVTRPSAYGAPLLHLSFVVALLLHLWGGLSGSEEVFRITEGGSRVRGATWRMVDLHHEAWPSGMPKVVEVTLERRGDDREEGERLVLGYNDPILLDGGATVLLLGEVGQAIRGVFERGGERIELGARESGEIGGARVRVHDVLFRRGLRVPVADVTVTPQGGRARRAMVGLGVGAPVEGLRFVDASAERAVVVRARHNPSFPWILAVSLAVALGAVLAGVERLSRGRLRTAIARRPS